MVLPSVLMLTPRAVRSNDDIACPAETAEMASKEMKNRNIRFIPGYDLRFSINF